MRNPIDWIAEKAGYVKRPPSLPRRSYQAAKTDRLVAGWLTSNTTGNRELIESLAALRARSRQLMRDNDYCKRFVELIQTNVIGPQGIGLENKARMRSDPSRLDERANEIIEEAWSEWCRLGNPTMDGTMSWTDAQGLWARTLATDGEVIMRKVRGPVNRWGFAVHFLEADQLNEQLNEDRPNRRIAMGIELDAWGRPQAYHLDDQHPGENAGLQRSRVVRIRADEIMHAFLKGRPTQHRGAPWIHTAMNRLKQLGGYEEAELISARVGASSMGFFTTPTGEEYAGEETEAGTGAKITEAEPGIFEELPRGQEFTAWNPSHPGGNFEPFVRAVLRGAAAGMGVSYHSLSGDLTDVNYSSIRSGTLEMRDHWRILQRFAIQHLAEPAFYAWFEMASLTGAIPYGIDEMRRVARPTWKVRGWEWVDPLKDINASVIAIQNGLSTRTIETAKAGQEYDEIIEQLAKEEQLARDKGVKLGQAQAASAPPAGSKGTQEDEDA